MGREKLTARLATYMAKLMLIASNNGLGSRELFAAAKVVELKDRVLRQYASGLAFANGFSYDAAPPLIREDYLLRAEAIMAGDFDVIQDGGRLMKASTLELTELQRYELLNMAGTHTVVNGVRTFKL